MLVDASAVPERLSERMPAESTSVVVTAFRRRLGMTGRFLWSAWAAMGRVRPANPLNSLPETCRSRWTATQPKFV
jgi:hypothetical protein